MLSTPYTAISASSGHASSTSFVGFSPCGPSCCILSILGAWLLPSGSLQLTVKFIFLGTLSPEQPVSPNTAVPERTIAKAFLLNSPVLVKRSRPERSLVPPNSWLLIKSPLIIYIVYLKTCAAPDRAASVCSQLYHSGA